MAAYRLGRVPLPRQPRAVYFLIFSTIILPPQITIISLFQLLVELRALQHASRPDPGLHRRCSCRSTIYLLESFFAQIPQDLFDAARIDGCSELGVFWRLTLPIGMPAVATTWS